MLQKKFLFIVCCAMAFGGAIFAGTESTETTDAAAYYKKAMRHYDDAAYSKAYPLLLKAANAGHGDASYNLGVLHERGQGVDRDYLQAAKWYEKAIASYGTPSVKEKGSIYAQYNLALLYAKGLGVSQDTSKAVDLLLPLVELNDANAQYDLACLCGEAKEYESAVTLYRRAAKQGHMKAQYALGIELILGRGTKKDEAAALECFTNAAEQGYRDAQYNVAEMNWNGQGCAVNKEKAILFYTLCAKQGDHDAQYKLGRIYEAGDGVSQDFRKAFYYYDLAAAQLPEAFYKLALFYYAGKGVEQDQTEAINRMKFLAKRDYSPAKKWLQKRKKQPSASK